MRVKMYALPEKEPASSFPGAPTTTESPEMETERPKLSEVAESSAVSWASSLTIRGSTVIG